MSAFSGFGKGRSLNSPHLLARLQGIDEQFLEQWHQKLHTNTTPDDIVICEAYLAFLHSNNHDDYFRVLKDNGNLTRDDLENFGKPISGECKTPLWNCPSSFTTTLYTRRCRKNG